MAPENVRDRKEQRRYTFVIIPGIDSDKTRSFSVTPLGVVLTSIASFLVIVALVTAAIVYTPIGSRLPVPNPELEQHYGAQVQEIRIRLGELLQEMDVLRGYNARLRQAMGEQLNRSDSALLSKATSSDRLSGMRQQFVPVSGETPGPGLTGRTPTDQMPSSRKTPIFPLTVPAEGFRTRGFDPAKFHYGIDIAGQQGSAVLAAADGNVTFSDWTYGDGLTLMIAHDLGLTTIYKHNKALLKQLGSPVRRGEPVALLGNTGTTSSGPHLHFEIWRDGVPENPDNLLLPVQ